MNADHMIANQDALGCKFECKQTEHPRFMRMFVIRPDGVTIGRLTVLDGGVAGFKQYKREGCQSPIDESDRVYAYILYFLATGAVLNVFDELVKMAHANVASDLAAKIAARELLPSKKRKPIKGKDVRRELFRLVNQMSYGDGGRSYTEAEHELATLYRGRG